MSDKIRDEIKSYSMDYRKEKSYEIKSNNISKTVVAGVPSLKKVKVEDIKIKDPFKREKKRKSKGIYIDAILPSKALLYRILFSCAILLLSLIGCIIFISVSSNLDESVDTNASVKNNFSSFL